MGKDTYVVFLLLGDSPASEFYMPTFRNSVCSSFIGDVSRKNNRDDIVGVFIREKVWLKNSLSQSEGGDEEGACPSRVAGCGGQRPQVEASGTYVREKRLYVGVRKGSHGLVEIKLLCFRWLSPLFKYVQKGFPGFALGQAIFSVHVV
jgi:hypothetical protein